MKSGDCAQKMKHNKNSRSDSILLDLLNIDRKHFFIRYKTDILGFIVIMLIMFLMIIAVAFLVRIGN